MFMKLSCAPFIFYPGIWYCFFPNVLILYDILISLITFRCRCYYTDAAVKVPLPIAAPAVSGKIKINFSLR